MATTAYLAYESADEDSASHITAELERNGWTVTRSSPELRSQGKLTALVQMIGQSSVVVVIASPAGQDSTWLQREVVAAAQYPMGAGAIRQTRTIIWNSQPEGNNQ